MLPSPSAKGTARRRRGVGLAVALGVALAAAGTAAATVADAASDPAPPSSAPGAQQAHVTGADSAAAGRIDFGANVTVFDPSTPIDEIQAKLDAAHKQQVDNEMGAKRYAFLFKPGTYGTAAHPLKIQVGYYTEISGLGASPTDVKINGRIESYNRCLDGANNCIALNTFWRTVSNLSLGINTAGQDECRKGANFWAVSQAVSLRRLNVTGGKLSLMDYCTNGPQFASGGYLADSKLPDVVNGSQQQWLSRNSEVASWSNGVWNQVFSGVVGAPSEAEFPAKPYTTVDKTPVSREKPYLFIDAQDRYQVRVPSVRKNSRGVSWANGITPGRTIPLSDFYVAKPSDSAQTINSELARGKHLLLTPGVYGVNRSLEVKRAHTVVLGIGHATLTAESGSTPLAVGDVPDVSIAGVTIDAGPKESKVLVKIGTGPHRGATTATSPTTLSDVYFRVGGPHVGKTDTALVVNSDNVLIDHTWVWRADHGIENFTEGVKGDTERWRTNIGRYGAVINGDNVTATGLFVEHFQRFNTTWNGENGTTILYQNELPYDPPTQADWTNNAAEGYPGYKVGDQVKNHRLYGAGVYVFNQNNPSIHTRNGFEVPKVPGVTLHHIMTVNLDAGTIDHVVNGVGAAADKAHSGKPVYVKQYP